MLIHEVMFIIGSYLLGSIPSGFILYYLMEKKDIRNEGSGNIGAANVMRTKGKTAGIATLILDMSKAIIPILFGMHYFQSHPAVIVSGGAAAVIGHLFSPYLKLRGGKGIASFAGLILVYYYPSALIFIAVFLLTLYLTRYVSASSVAGVITVSIFFLLTQPKPIAIIILILALLIVFKHYPNFKRILHGTEYPFSPHCHSKGEKNIENNHD
ncbi:MAG: glycerol-3-phosphate 1-O-acyltransferase PlsY [Candidatus Omnitrophota bacterium]